MKLSCAVMAHRKRVGYVRQLVRDLDRDVVLVFDEYEDRWDTGKRSMQAYDPSATHHLVVQDDAIVPRDLIAGCERMLDFVSPNVPISLYTGRSRPNQFLVQPAVARALEQSCSFLRMPGPWWGVGIVVPTACIDEMLADCGRRPDIANYDLRIANWFNEQHIQCLYTVPSLVDHRDGPSLVRGRNGRGRVATHALLPTASALDVEWSRLCLDVNARNGAGLKGEVEAFDTDGRRHIVTAKSFREILIHRGWTLAEEKEVAHA